jgi:hypothetical protein
LFRYQVVVLGHVALLLVVELDIEDFLHAGQSGSELTFWILSSFLFLRF